MDLTEALHKIQQLEQEISSLRRELQLAKLQAPDEGYRERFIVNTFKGEKVVDVSEVRYIVSENKSTYIVLHDGSSFNIDMPLSIIAGQLCPRTFMKVNRKYIIPLSMVERFEQDINGKERLILKHGRKNPKITISRDNKNIVHNWVNGVHTP
jgi:DNA-binding LytR/AlgR family response regulator